MPAIVPRESRREATGPPARGNGNPVDHLPKAFSKRGMALSSTIPLSSCTHARPQRWLVPYLVAPVSFSMAPLVFFTVSRAVVLPPCCTLVSTSTLTVVSHAAVIRVTYTVSRDTLGAVPPKRLRPSNGPISSRKVHPARTAPSP